MKEAKELGVKFWYQLTFRVATVDGNSEMEYVDVLADNADDAEVIASNAVEMEWGVSTNKKMGTAEDYANYVDEYRDVEDWDMEDEAGLPQYPKV